MFLEMVLLPFLGLFALAQRSTSPNADAENMHLRHSPEQTPLEMLPIRPSVSFHVLFCLSVRLALALIPFRVARTGSLDTALGLRLPGDEGDIWIGSTTKRLGIAFC